MKANRFLAIAFVLVSSVFADTLYLKDGREIKDATVTKIGDTDVEYKINNRETLYTAKKSDITIIIYDDGTKDMFGSEPEKKASRSCGGEKGQKMGNKDCAEWLSHNRR